MRACQDTRKEPGWLECIGLIVALCMPIFVAVALLSVIGGMWLVNAVSHLIACVALVNWAWRLLEWRP